MCKQKPEPNLIKLAEDHALGKIMGDVDEDEGEEAGEDSGGDEDQE